MEGGNKPDQQTVITNQVGSRRLSPTDWRAKIGPYKKADFDQIFGPNLKNKEMRQVLGTGEDGTGDRQDTILQPLKDIGGIIYPYTPTILVTGQANYNEMTFTHYNYPIYSFMNSTPPVFTVSGPFTANNVNEARYLLAVLNFLKVCIKAQNGRGAMNTGFRVPPVLAFSYLGPNGYDKVPCVIRNYSYQLRDDVDYVPVDTQDYFATKAIYKEETDNLFLHQRDGSDNYTTYVPTSVDILIDLAPQYNPSELRKRFDLDLMTQGALGGKYT
jgi:hypothetical protein